MIRRPLLLFAIVFVAVALSLLAAASAQSSDFDIVFDSNRSGNFGIYRVDAKGERIRTVVDSPKHEMYPAVSPDGKRIAFARTDSLERDGYADVYLIAPDGTNERLLVKDATFPSFTADGKYLYVERQRRQLVRVEIATGEAKVVFPTDKSSFQKRYVVKPVISPDGTQVAFSSNNPDKWHAWIADIQSGSETRIGRGCQPTWAGPEPRRLVWVKRAAEAGSGVYAFKQGAKDITPVADAGEDFGKEYFPSVSPDGKLVTYSAAPSDQHSHITSNYQIFITDFETKKRRRLFSDKHNNRWPKFLVQTR